MIFYYDSIALQASKKSDNTHANKLIVIDYLIRDRLIKNFIVSVISTQIFSTKQQRYHHIYINIKSIFHIAQRHHYSILHGKNHDMA